MAYIRKRGNQLVIVHGERDPETGKVQQRILFTIYSKAEALSISGRKDLTRSNWFQDMLEMQNPGIRFPWLKIKQSIEENLHGLPDLYNYKASRLQENFRTELCSFAKQIILTDPQELFSSAQLIKSNQYELDFISDLIRLRLELREQSPNEWNKDDPFYWRSSMRGEQVPAEAEEMAKSYYKNGNFDKAKAVFKMLIDCFKNYAEGYNYLGLIALEERNFDEALPLFRDTISVGQRLFPKKLGKKHFWIELSTRPYMRGMRNLAYTLNMAGEFDEALSICNRLESQCDDTITADSYRAQIYMNMQFWQQAFEAALVVHQTIPSFAFITSMACFELRRYKEALQLFLFGALNYPQASMLLTGQSTYPVSNDEITDYNEGVGLCGSLHNYKSNQTPASQKFFKSIITHPVVIESLKKLSDAKKTLDEQNSTNDRTIYNTILHIQSEKYVKQCSDNMIDILHALGSKMD